MNQKKAKKLRRIAKLAVLRSTALYPETRYQEGKGGFILSPLCERAIYQTMKGAFHG
jgi:hypothetical protein